MKSINTYSLVSFFQPLLCDCLFSLRTPKFSVERQVLNFLLVSFYILCFSLSLLFRLPCLLWLLFPYFILGSRPQYLCFLFKVSCCLTSSSCFLGSHFPLLEFSANASCCSDSFSLNVYRRFSFLAFTRKVSYQSPPACDFVYSEYSVNSKH